MVLDFSFQEAAVIIATQQIESKKRGSGCFRSKVYYIYIARVAKVKLADLLRAPIADQNMFFNHVLSKL